MQNFQAPADSLKERVILVTGAGDGIGRVAAETFAAHGAEVVLLGRTVAKLEATYDAIIQAGHAQPAIVPLDLAGATESHYRDMVDAILESCGRLDGALLNAGILGQLAPFEHIHLEEWQQVLHVNVTAQMLMARALLPVLKQAPDGRLIFTSSGVGRRGRAFWGTYAVSKFATEGMMEVIADEVSRTALRVNCINPGATRTAMRAEAFPAEDPLTLKTPQDIMPTYLFLMGPAGADTHGQSVDAQPR